MASMSIAACWPSFITDPFPKLSSIWFIAASKALQVQKAKFKQGSDNLARLKLSQREGTGKEFHDKVLSLRKAQEQFPPIKHMELNDTGLATHLSRNGKKTISKEQLVKDFDDKLAPDIDVAVLGSDQRNLNVLRKIERLCLFQNITQHLMYDQFYLYELVNLGPV